MGTDLSAVPHVAACPSCGAALRPDAPWCSLCYHDLRPAPAPAPEQPMPPSYGGLDPLTAPLLDLVLPPVPAPAAPVEQQQPAPAAPPTPDVVAWPCTRCSAKNPIDSPVCGVCGSAFLAAASEPLSLVVPGVGDLSRFSRAQRAGIAAAVLMAVLLPLAILTFVLTAPPKAGGSQGTSTEVITVAP